MSIFFKARSGKFSSSFGIFLIRLSLGSLFLFSGASKVIHLQQFIKSVQETGQMNDTLAFILAFVLPFMELIFGALYIIGLFTPISSFFIACMTISFLITLGFRHEELPFSYNIIFLACSLATMFTGAGLYSFDAMIDRKKVTPNPNININVKDTKSNSGSFTDQKSNISEAIYVDEKEVASGEDVNG